MQIQTLAKISLLIFLSYIVYGIYVGLLHPIPAPGDSWDYHIPIAQTILNGSFLNLDHAKLPQWYYPGSSEIFIALFTMLNIPLTLSNIFAIVVLFFSCWKLARVFKLDYYYALLFATTFCSINGIIRWLNAVSIDVWVAVFFCWTIILLKQPRKSLAYFLKLGIVCGMLIGSKYTACTLLVVLLLFYGKKLITYLSINRLIIFVLPFTVLGLFWYIRNLLLKGNPMYPLDFFGLPNAHIFSDNILSVTLSHPSQMFDAFFGEYKLWCLVLVVVPIYLFNTFKKNKLLQFNEITVLMLIGIMNGLFFLQFPTSEQTWIMVSSFRYSYPIFIPILLSIFLLAKQYKQEINLGYFALANMLVVTSFVYYPKLIIFYLPLALIAFYFIDKYNPGSRKVKQKTSFP